MFHQLLFILTLPAPGLVPRGPRKSIEKLPNFKTAQYTLIFSIAFCLNPSMKSVLVFDQLLYFYVPLKHQKTFQGVQKCNIENKGVNAMVASFLFKSQPTRKTHLAKCSTRLKYVSVLFSFHYSGINPSRPVHFRKLY